MKNYKYIDGKLTVEYGDHRFEIIDPTEAILELVNNEECTCSIIPVVELQAVLAGGINDCPVHGFKKEKIKKETLIDAKNIARD